MRRLALVLALGLVGAAGEDSLDGEAPDSGQPHLRARQRALRDRLVTGAREQERAIAGALRWLADHQDNDGQWDADDFIKHDPPEDRCDGAGHPLRDVGVTALSLLAFLRAGYGTHEGATDDAAKWYAGTVRAGLRRLLAWQDAEGAYGSRHQQQWIYGHAMATLAMAEAYGMMRSPAYGKSAQRAVDLLLAARNPDRAWRYGIREGENDTSVTAWCVLALHSARLAGLRVDKRAFKGALAWVQKMTDPEWGQVGYNIPGGPSCRMEGLQERWPPGQSRALTGAGILLRTLCGEDPRTEPLIRKGADLCLGLPPSWNPDAGTIDMIYWYFGSEAMHQLGGARWRKWDEARREAILHHQHPPGRGARSGSWDPIDPWGREGGRVYATALLALTLLVEYRSERVFGTD